MLRNEMIYYLMEKQIITKDNTLRKKYKKALMYDIITLQKIVEFTSFLKYDAPINSRIYCIIQNITTQPTCKTCNEPLKMRTNGKVRHTFGKFCSGACVAKNDNVKQKRISTNIKRYGVKNTFEVEEFKNKII